MVRRSKGGDIAQAEVDGWGGGSSPFPAPDPHIHEFEIIFQQPEGQLERNDFFLSFGGAQNGPKMGQNDSEKGWLGKIFGQKLNSYLIGNFFYRFLELRFLNM